MAGKGYGLLTDAFHQIAVRAQNDGAVVDKVAAEARGKRGFRDCHANRARKPLPERAGRHFNAGSMAKFRMARGF